MCVCIWFYIVVHFSHIWLCPKYFLNIYFFFKWKKVLLFTFSLAITSRQDLQASMAYLLLKKICSSFLGSIMLIFISTHLSPTKSWHELVTVFILIGLCKDLLFVDKYLIWFIDYIYIGHLYSRGIYGLYFDMQEHPSWGCIFRRLLRAIFCTQDLARLTSIWLIIFIFTRWETPKIDFWWNYLLCCGRIQCTVR